MTKYLCPKPDPADELPMAWDGDVENIEPCFVFLGRENVREGTGPIKNIAYYRPTPGYVSRTTEADAGYFEKEYGQPYWWDARQRHRAEGPALYGETRNSFYVDGYLTARIMANGDVWFPKASTVAAREGSKPTQRYKARKVKP